MDQKSHGFRYQTSPSEKIAAGKRAEPPKLKLVAKQQYRPNMAPANAYPPSIIQRAQAMASYATRQPAPRKPGRKPPASPLRCRLRPDEWSPQRERPFPHLLRLPHAGSSSHTPAIAPASSPPLRSWDSRQMTCDSRSSSPRSSGPLLLCSSSMLPENNCRGRE